MTDEYKLNPCKCGSKKEPDLDSDDMIPCWMARCFDCNQAHHNEGSNWTMIGAVKKWNKENTLPNAP